MTHIHTNAYTHREVLCLSFHHASFPNSHPCVEKEDGKTSSDDKGVYRRCWEIYHGTSGFISIAIGFGQVCAFIMIT